MKYGKENEDRNVNKLIRYYDLSVINTSEAQPVFKPISFQFICVNSWNGVKLRSCYMNCYMSNDND